MHTFADDVLLITYLQTAALCIVSKYNNGRFLVWSTKAVTGYSIQPSRELLQDVVKTPHTGGDRCQVNFQVISRPTWKLATPKPEVREKGRSLIEVLKEQNLLTACSV